MKRISFIQFILTVVFVVSLLISNVITGKQVQLPMGIVMPSAVFLFPITYVLSDLFSEIYGYNWSRFTRYLGFVANVFMVLVFSIALASPSPDYWHNQEAFEIVLGNTPRVLLASMTAYLVGDLVNDVVFKRMKERYPDTHDGFSLRAILSSFCGELVDSLIFLPIAFIGQMPMETLLLMMSFQVLIKTSIEIILVPFTKRIVIHIGRLEASS